MSTYDEKIAAAADVSAEYIRRLVAQEIEASKEALAIARFASSAIGNYSRHLSVKHNHERTVIGLAQRIAENPEQFMEYMTRALPDAGFIRALPAPSEKPKKAAAA